MKQSDCWICVYYYSSVVMFLQKSERKKSNHTLSSLTTCKVIIYYSSKDHSYLNNADNVHNGKILNDHFVGILGILHYIILIVFENQKINEILIVLDFSTAFNNVMKFTKTWQITIKVSSLNFQVFKLVQYKIYNIYYIFI